MSDETQSKYSVVETIRQSPPLDLSLPTNSKWVKDRTILITGGASGFGEAFFESWAGAGANVIIGDINVKKGDQLVRRTIEKTGNKNLHFFHCDVTDWQSQVELFKSAVKVSPHGGIDCVVANAGIVDTKGTFQRPQGLDGVNPPAPELSVLDVNLKGVMYTTHLALFWLPRNPGSSDANPHAKPSETERDRHLLLISSLAGIAPIPTQIEYTAAKHALVGLYRSLRSSAFVNGIRTNLLCPYHVATPLQTGPSHAILAGGAMAECEDVVEAATRFVASPNILGRALIICPKMNGEKDSQGLWTFSDKSTGEKRGVVEIFAHDWEETELSQRRLVNVLNTIVEVRGWTGWFVDMMRAVKLGLGL